MPRDPFTDEPLNVKVGFDVNSIAEINEPEESVILKFCCLFEIVFITKSFISDVFFTEIQYMVKVVR